MTNDSTARDSPAIRAGRVPDTLAQCHRLLSDVLRQAGARPDPLEAGREVERHRLYWRPDRVRVVLLAESHVATTLDELDRTVDLGPAAPPGIPTSFARFVYCLGYGENGILNRPITIPPNGGTPQFWKLLYSCAYPVNGNSDFTPILHTTSTETRIANKISLLVTLKDLGVWLLDASPAALYFPGRPKPPGDILKRCMQIGWDTHVRHRLEDAAPQEILCIGTGVRRALEERLARLHIPVTFLPQPQAHLSSGEHLGAARFYWSITRAANGQPSALAQANVVSRPAGRARHEPAAVRRPMPSAELDLAHLNGGALLIKLGDWMSDSDTDLPRQGFGYRPGMSNKELYDSARAWWHLDQPRAARRPFAIAVHRGIAVGIWEIDHGSWRQASPETVRRLGKTRRWAFSGRRAEDLEASIIGRRIPTYKPDGTRLFGTGSVIAYWPR